MCNKDKIKLQRSLYRKLRISKTNKKISKLAIKLALKSLPLKDRMGYSLFSLNYKIKKFLVKRFYVGCTLNCKYCDYRETCEENYEEPTWKQLITGEFNKP